jgi:crotonobetainyl-CoA:carnitine CoA-transferase CaiB-like acyl-CoA transferase
MYHALEGTKVLDLTSFMAGPFATMLPGDLGAEIIKVNQPGDGDMFRGWNQKPRLYSPLFCSFNLNKKRTPFTALALVF